MAMHRRLVESSRTKACGRSTSVPLLSVPLDWVSISSLRLAASELLLHRMDGAFWYRQLRGSAVPSACVGTLVDLDVGAIVETSLDTVLGPQTALAWPDALDHPEMYAGPIQAAGATTRQ